MRKLTLATLGASLVFATGAWAAPMPSAATGIGQATTTDIIHVKKKKKMSKKMMKNDGDMNGQGSSMGSGGMQGGSMGSGGMAKPQ